MCAWCSLLACVSACASPAHAALRRNVGKHPLQSVLLSLYLCVRFPILLSLCFFCTCFACSCFPAFRGCAQFLCTASPHCTLRLVNVHWFVELEQLCAPVVRPSSLRRRGLRELLQHHCRSTESVVLLVLDLFQPRYEWLYLSRDLFLDFCCLLDLLVLRFQCLRWYPSIICVCLVQFPIYRSVIAALNAAISLLAAASEIVAGGLCLDCCLHCCAPLSLGEIVPRAPSHGKRSTPMLTGGSC